MYVSDILSSLDSCDLPLKLKMKMTCLRRKMKIKMRTLKVFAFTLFTIKTHFTRISDYLWMHFIRFVRTTIWKIKCPVESVEIKIAFKMALLSSFKECQIFPIYEYCYYGCV